MKSVFTIVESQKDAERKFWIRIGRAFENRDGSTTVYLDALPVNGMLQIREENNRRTES
jgi:hypothetical protein